MFRDLLLRKETPLVLPQEESPAIGLRRVSLSGAWVTRRALPYYPVGNRVVVVSHEWPSVVEWHAVLHGLRSLHIREAHTPCDRVRVMLFAELRSSCSLRLCTDYASCRAAGVWSLWAFPSVGLGPVAYFMVRGRGPDDAICHH
ncbi:hypothetical protein Tco_0459395 [Tanacetum coccineum]